jgi:hypothetical protein
VLYNEPDPSGSGTRPVWEASPEALIVAPPPGSLVAGAIEIWGWAWAAAGVARVEISLDDGVTWSPAQLDARRQWSWQRFAFDWRPPRNGRFTLAARASDTRGEGTQCGSPRNHSDRMMPTLARRFRRRVRTFTLRHPHGS